jgi:hypothetical protein
MAVAVIAAPWPEIVALIGTGPPNFSVPVAATGIIVVEGQHVDRDGRRRAGLGASAAINHAVAASETTRPARKFIAERA